MRVPLILALLLLASGLGLSWRTLRRGRDLAQRMHASEERFLAIAEQLGELISITDETGKIKYASPAAFPLFRLHPEEMVGRHFSDFLEESSVPMAMAAFREAIENGLPTVNLELQMKRGDGSVFYGELTGYLHRTSSQSGTLVTIRDISARKRTEESLRHSRELMRYVIENDLSGVAVLDRDMRYLFVSRRFLDEFRVRERDIIGKYHYEVFPEIPEHIRDVHRRAMAGELLSGSEEPFRRPDGSTDWTRWECRPWFEPGGGTGGIVIYTTVINSLKQQEISLQEAHDKLELLLRQAERSRRALLSMVEDQKQAQERIRASLKEKEVLLQEIHHRVKNNLQVISGLLTMQADQAGGRPLAEIFRESQDRIRSIALIHEKLYGSQDLSEIAFDEYLRALVGNLLLSYGIAASSIRAAFDLEPVRFTIEKAIPLGLIVNELVTNAIKHAFPGGRRGEVRIGMHVRKSPHPDAAAGEGGPPSSEAMVELSVGDDGVGLPEDFEARSQRSLGMNLVRMLARQVQAELQVKAGAGGEFRIVVPAEPKKG